MKSSSPPIVMDTNVLVAGACRHESSLAYQVLLAALQQRVPLMLTEGIIAEYEDVLSRPAIRTLTGLSQKQNGDLILDFIALSRQTQLSFSWRPNLMDESDNKFVEAAIAATAIIVTYNVRDFGHCDLKKFGWDVMTLLEYTTLYDLEAH
jgi:predicted nucleic acid-binding protein